MEQKPNPKEWTTIRLKTETVNKLRKLTGHNGCITYDDVINLSIELNKIDKKKKL